MARNLQPLPRAHVYVELMLQLRDFAADTFEILRGLLVPGSDSSQVLNLSLKLFDFPLSLLGTQTTPPSIPMTALRFSCATGLPHRFHKSRARAAPVPAPARFPSLLPASP